MSNELTQNDIQKIKFEATLLNQLNRYVYLRQDDKGMYIEYAFIKGTPHDNRCLSWYDSYQENAYKRNNWTKNCTKEEEEKYYKLIKQKREERVGKLFYLLSFTCGYEESEEECLNDAKESWLKFHPNKPFVPKHHICKVGHPAKKCKKTHCINWTYEEPVKCACWHLNEVHVPTKISVPIEDAMKFYNNKQ